VLLTLGQAIITASVIIPMALCTMTANNPAVAQCGPLTTVLLFAIWLSLLVVLVADPVLRQKVSDDYQQHANETQKRGVEEIIEMPLDSGPYLGMVFLDSVNL
jgi:hypothetical protein